MTVQHQEIEEPPTSEVVRLAQQLYERDRAEQERHSSLAAAAEEMGIPSQYLDKAAAQLKARRSVVSQQPLVQRRPVAAVLMLAFSLMLGVFLLFFLTYARTQAPPMLAPPVPIEAAPPTPVLPSPTPGPGTRITPEPYPVPGMAVPPPAPAGPSPSPTTGY